MRVELDAEGTCAGFAAAAERLARTSGVEGLLALCCDANGFLPSELDPLLERVGLPLFGGCFPGILYQDRVYDRGSLLVGLPAKPEIQLIADLESRHQDFDSLIQAAESSYMEPGTKILLVDGMSLYVNSLLESVFNAAGLAEGYIGGGASSLDLVPKPSLFTNNGLRGDCAILAHIPLPSGIGIAHGMRSVAGPFKVTSATFNEIRSLDWQPAAQLYKNTILNHPDYDPGILGFLGTDAHYSLGLNRMDAERVILEPVREGEQESLLFMQQVREGEFVNVMHISADSMIASAATALERALENIQGQGSPKTILTFDCVSRRLFLGNRFQEELKAIASEGTVHIGALTCGGEIGTSGKDFLDYHNRTCVIGVFPE